MSENIPVPTPDENDNVVKNLTSQPTLFGQVPANGSSEFKIKSHANSATQSVISDGTVAVINIDDNGKW